MTSAPCRRCTDEAVPRAEKFGDLITADHKIFNEEGESRNNHQYAVVVQDLAHGGFNPIRVKQRLHMRRKKFVKVLRTATQAKKKINGQIIGVWKFL